MIIAENDLFQIVRRDSLVASRWAMNAPAYQYIIIKKNSSGTIGHCLIARSFPPEIEGIWLDERYHSQGLGKWLVASVFREYNCPIVVCRWKIINPGALAFFEKMAKYGYVDLQ